MVMAQDTGGCAARLSFGVCMSFGHCMLQRAGWGLTRGSSSGQGQVQPLRAWGSQHSTGCTSGSHRPLLNAGELLSQLSCSRAQGRELTPHLLSLQGVLGCIVGLCPPHKGQGCPQGGQATLQLRSEDGGAGMHRALVAVGEGWCWEPNCPADTAITVPNWL